LVDDYSLSSFSVSKLWNIFEKERKGENINNLAHG